MAEKEFRVTEEREKNVLKKILNTISKYPGHKILDICSDDYVNERLNKEKKKKIVNDKFDVGQQIYNKKSQLDRILQILVKFESLADYKSEGVKCIEEISLPEMREIVNSLPFAGYSHLDNSFLGQILDKIQGV